MGFNRQFVCDNLLGLGFSWYFISVIGVVFDDGLQVGHIELIKKCLHGEILLVKLGEEFLRMAADLGARTCADMLLNILPLLAKVLKRL